MAHLPIGFVIILLLLQILVLVSLIFIFSSGIRSMIAGAPFVPMKRSIIKRMLKFGDIQENDIVFDLGCGDGRILRSCVKDFIIKEAVGYEVALWPYLLSKYLNRQNKLNNKIIIKRTNGFKADLSEATLIYLYLFPGLVDKFANKIEQEVKPGTRVLCPSFAINLAAYPRFKLKKEAKIDNITTYLYEIV